MRHLLCFAAGLALAGSTARAEPAPASVARHAYGVNAAVQARVEAMPVGDLSGDDYFLNTLRDILRRGDGREADKADAFYLMLKKIRWGFSGAVQIAPGFDYPQTFRGHVVTYFSYQDGLRAAALGASNLMDVAAAEYKTNVVRAGHALLLAALADREGMRARLPFFIDPDVIRAAQVPDILLHHVALAAALARDEDLAAGLGRLWDVAASEEAREDILCCLGLFGRVVQIRTLIAAEKDPEHDLTVETGVIVLKRVSPAEDFAATFDQILEANAMWRDQLKALQSRGFRSAVNEKRGYWKTWDGMDVAVYGDGFQVSHKPGFSDFVPGGERSGEAVQPTAGNRK